jgi:uncharacterized membrane protein YtjA (UPF0391 family)
VLCQLSAPFVEKDLFMLRPAIAFLTVALLAVFFGFRGVASYSWVGAKILFLIFILLVLAVSSYLRGTYYQRRTY